MNPRLKYYDIALNVKSEGLNLLDESQCILSEYNQDISDFKELSRTESVVNPNNLRWSNKLHLQLTPSSIQILKFTINNIFNESICSSTTTLQSLLVSNPYTLEMENSEKKLIIKLEEENKIPETIYLQLKGKHLDKKDLFGLSDPYFLLYKMTQQGWTEVYHSEVIKNTLDPAWNEVKLKADTFGGTKSNIALKVEVWDWDRSKKDDFIGVTDLSLTELLTAGKEFELVNLKKQKKIKNYENSGVLQIASAKVDIWKSFVDFFIEGGKIEFGFGIDFTLVNGNSSIRTSNHYIESGVRTKYEEIILYLHESLKDYNRPLPTTLYGFGALSACLNPCASFFSFYSGTEEYKYDSVDSALSLYRDSVPLIVLGHEAKIAPMIEHYVNSVNRAEVKNYSVLFILVCGQISDTNELNHVVRASSRLPTSLVLIEVSSYMVNDPKSLNPLHYNQELRDNFQFVRLKDYKNLKEACIATLERIPSQIEAYFNRIN